MIKLAGTSKKVAGGFVPMITIRGARGQMMGSRIAKSEAVSYDNALEAELAANVVALRMALEFDCVRV